MAGIRPGQPRAAKTRNGEPAPVESGDDAQEACHDQRDTRRQPVQPIDEVHCIGNEQQPNDGCRRPQPADVKRPDIRHAVVHNINAAAHSHQRRQNLSAQLYGELPVVEIVQECHHRDRHRRLDHADESTDSPGVRTRRSDRAPQCRQGTRRRRQRHRPSVWLSYGPCARPADPAHAPRASPAPRQRRAVPAWRRTSGGAGRRQGSCGAG